jgi:hypothetical protein
VAASSAVAAPPAAPAAEAKPGATGPSAPAVVWDGDKNGPSGKGWASCSKDKEGKCKVTADAKPGVGRNGTVGLEFKAKGPDWMGCGWNWYGWWPNNGGDDITGKKNLVFWVKLQSPKAPDPSGLKVSLASSTKDKEQSNEVTLGNYVKNLSDGQWHEVKIPVSELLQGDKGKIFDAKKAWEFRVGGWYQDEQEYTITVDDIGFN